MRPEACFDMSNRHACRSRRERTAERAGCVSLNNQEIGTVFDEDRRHHFGNCAHMVVRILAASAAEADDRVDSQPESFLVEMRMLAGEDCRGRKAECIKGRGDRFELDGFWPGPDDQPNISA